MIEGEEVEEVEEVDSTFVDYVEKEEEEGEEVLAHYIVPVDDVDVDDGYVVASAASVAPAASGMFVGGA